MAGINMFGDYYLSPKDYFGVKALSGTSLCDTELEIKYVTSGVHQNQFSLEFTDGPCKGDTFYFDWDLNLDKPVGVVLRHCWCCECLDEGEELPNQLEITFSNLTDCPCMNCQETGDDCFEVRGIDAALNNVTFTLDKVSDEACTYLYSNSPGAYGFLDWWDIGNCHPPACHCEGDPDSTMTLNSIVLTAQILSKSGSNPRVVIGSYVEVSGVGWRQNVGPGTYTSTGTGDCGDIDGASFVVECDSATWIGCSDGDILIEPVYSA